MSTTATAGSNWVGNLLDRRRDRRRRRGRGHGRGPRHVQQREERNRVRLRRHDPRGRRHEPRCWPARGTTRSSAESVDLGRTRTRWTHRPGRRGRPGGMGGDGFDMISFNNKEEDPAAPTAGVTLTSGTALRPDEGTDTFQSFEAVWGSRFQRRSFVATQRATSSSQRRAMTTSEASAGSTTRSNGSPRAM